MYFFVFSYFRAFAIDSIAKVRKHENGHGVAARSLLRSRALAQR